MRRVLFIVYYFPPSGGAGVQRGLKFLRYLPDFGWEATVLTVPSGAGFPVRDESLLAEIPDRVTVRRTRCPELYDLYRVLSGRRKEADIETASQSAGERGPLRRVLRGLRATLFIPDGRMLWRPFAVRAGRGLLRSAPHDLIFSSGPPFTGHLIARSLHRWSGKPWVADYRDPWTQATFYPRRPAWARAIDLRLEAACVREAAATVVVGEGMAEEFRRRYPELAPERFVVIPNGFDEADFAAVPYRHPEEFRITHAGSLFLGRIPHAFFTVLKERMATDADFAARLRLCFAGRLDRDARRLLQSPPFDRVSELPGYLEHPESVALLRKSRLLLLSTGTDAQARSMVTGKVYEYLASGVPILALAPPDGDAARLIAAGGAGWTLAPDDQEGIRNRLQAIWDAERARPSPGGPPPERPPQFGLERDEGEILRYTRRELTRRLAELFTASCA